MNDPSIFSRTGDWRLNAGVNYPNDAHMLMSEGYLQAAQRLILSLEDSCTGVDFLVYPIVFIYRHWFELRLKDIIIQGRRLVQEEGKYPTGHKLHCLWPTARAMIEKVWSESDRPSEFDLIDAAVAEFEKFDSNSQSSIPNRKRWEIFAFGVSPDKSGELFQWNGADRGISRRCG